MRELLSGNEAVARGAYEAGVVFASAYPGTPSTEILENIARYPEIEAQWAPNEKVALETAAGAALAGGRALVAMKHVGLNVAADPFFSLAYMGVNGGLVVVSADDPGMHSSQNEQDNRWYARAAKVPMLEPADSQEALEFTRRAFEISEAYNTPVLLRITTRIAHSMSVVEPGKRSEFRRPYRRMPEHHVLLPSNSRRIHPEIEARLKALAEDDTFLNLNRMELRSPSLGIVSSGVAYQYAREVFPQASFLKLAMTHPLPRKLLHHFADRVERLLVVEELDPFLEEQIRALGIHTIDFGDNLRLGELTPHRLRRYFEQGHAAAQVEEVKRATAELPPRPPALCAGCPHTGVFWALKKLRATVMGDIGCYTLGALPPLSAMHSCLNMGASIGMAEGMRTVLAGSGAKVVAVIGDSTFVHSGITPLIDIVYNRRPTAVVILDNETTAMTGHQEHPGTGKTLKGEPTRRIDYMSLCRSVGIEKVVEINPYDLEETLGALKTALQTDETTVVIARFPCVLKIRKRLGQPYFIDPEKCPLCNLCLKLGCPAIEREAEGLHIDTEACVGCGLCAAVCNLDAIAPLPFAPEKLN